MRTDHGAQALDLMVTGAKCAGCIAKIERTVLAVPGVSAARLNLTTGRLRVSWPNGAAPAEPVVQAIADLGYGVSVFDPEAHRNQIDLEGRRLLRALAVAGFGMMNIMMFSVPIWSGDAEMGEATRTLLHWVSAIIAVPVALYAGQPFFRSAFAALRKGRANMDVPISLGLSLALTLSLFETATGGRHAYFDGACMLLFLLLIGRYLDHRLRERARTAARDLLAQQATSAARIGADGVVTAVAPSALQVDDLILIPAGERIPADGLLIEGTTELDQSMLTGESQPALVKPGDRLHAGSINLGRSVTMRVSARVEDSTLASLAQLIEIGEQGRAKYIRIADRAARLYVPVVHSLAAATLLGWLFGPTLLAGFGMTMEHVGLHDAMLNAIAVLIITCPCALGLAVPAVHIVTSGRLFQRGVLIKSGDALERLAEIDYVVIDKTGTLTLGRPKLLTTVTPQLLTAAASLARASRHPLARALVAAAGPGVSAGAVEEVPGEGLAGVIDGDPARIGRRSFAAPAEPDAGGDNAELWFAWGSRPPIRFAFEDALRPDAAATISAFRARGIEVELVSGDRAAAVEAAARSAGIARFSAGVSPEAKVARLQALRAAGRKPLMIGDGLNDAAALAAAHASMSPATGVEIAHAASDIVVQGESLMVAVAALDAAKIANARVVENLAFSVIYNLVAVPIAMLGFVTPFIAAAAMSGSSLAVTLNALRPQRWAS